MNDFNIARKVIGTRCNQHEHPIAFFYLAEGRQGAGCALECRSNGRVKITPAQLQSLFEQYQKQQIKYQSQSVYELDSLLKKLKGLIKQDLEKLKQDAEQAQTKLQKKIQHLQKIQDLYDQKRQEIEKKYDTTIKSIESLSESLQKQVQTDALSTLFSKYQMENFTNDNVQKFLQDLSGINIFRIKSQRIEIVNSQPQSKTQIQDKINTLYQIITRVYREQPLGFIRSFSTNVDLKILKLLIATYNREDRNFEDAIPYEIVQEISKQYLDAQFPRQENNNQNLIYSNFQLKLISHYIQELKQIQSPVYMCEHKTTLEMEPKPLQLLTDLGQSKELSEVDLVTKLWSGYAKLHVEKNISISTIAYSHDAKYLACGGQDGIIRIIEASSGIQQSQLSKHESSISSIDYSPDGKYLASSSLDKFILIWEAQTWRIARSISGELNPFSTVTFSPNSNFLASCNHKTLIIWETLGWSKSKELDGHTQPINSVAYSRDGKLLVSASNDVRVVNAQSGSHIKTITGSEIAIKQVAFSPDGKKLVAGNVENQIWIWNTSDWSYKRIQSAGCQFVMYSLDGKYLLSGSSRSICIWDAMESHIQSTDFHQEQDKRVALSPDGRLWAISFEEDVLIYPSYK